MDAYKAIVGKRDVRRYLHTPIPAEVEHRILQAGRMAGSSKNDQPYRFVVLKDPERKMEFSGSGNFMTHVPSAPMVIAIVMPDTHLGFDAGRAAQNMMLAAWADGVASCPVVAHNAEYAKKVLGLPPGHHVALAIAFGYPQPEQARSNQKRLPLEEITYYERWGQRQLSGASATMSMANCEPPPGRMLASATCTTMRAGYSGPLKCSIHTSWNGRRSAMSWK